MDEGTLGVHQIELVVQSGEDLGHGCGVGDHTHCSLNLGKITSWDNSWWLVVDAALETSWAPVNKLDCPAERKLFHLQNLFSQQNESHAESILPD